MYYYVRHLVINCHRAFYIRPPLERTRRHSAFGLSVRESMCVLASVLTHLINRLWGFHQIHYFGAVCSKIYWLDFEAERSKVKVTSCALGGILHLSPIYMYIWTYFNETYYNYLLLDPHNDDTIMTFVKSWFTNNIRKCTFPAASYRSNFELN